LSGMGSTIERNRVPTYPVIKPLGCGVKMPAPRIADCLHCHRFLPLELGPSLLLIGLNE
jgi:hypothetical protein